MPNRGAVSRNAQGGCCALQFMLKTDNGNDVAEMGRYMLRPYKFIGDGEMEERAGQAPPLRIYWGEAKRPA